MNMDGEATILTYIRSLNNALLILLILSDLADLVDAAFVHDFVSKMMNCI